MGSKIKICGLRREEDIRFVNELKPDYIGFILTDGFRRTVDWDTACRLRSMLDEDITPVGVFVNDDPDKINELIRLQIISMVQLHGEESPEYCKKINAPVIKYLKCGRNTEEQLKQYRDVDYFLFDSGAGSGKTFNWSMIPKTDQPFFLAGGIGADNIEKAIRQIKPFAVDVSSSVETDGCKDYVKMKEIIGRARYE